MHAYNRLYWCLQLDSYICAYSLQLTFINSCNLTLYIPTLTLYIAATDSFDGCNWTFIHACNWLYCFLQPDSAYSCNWLYRFVQLDSSLRLRLTLLMHATGLVYMFLQPASDFHLFLQLDSIYTYIDCIHTCNLLYSWLQLDSFIYICNCLSRCLQLDSIYGCNLTL